MEDKILTQFLFEEKLKFNEIEKRIKIRSNKLSYHLKNLLNKNILKKSGEFYKLSPSGEYILPYLSEKRAVLPIILIKIGKKNNYFLYKRDKRPFKEKLSLPGGRLIIGESISQAVKRIMKDKFNILAKLNRILSISLEHAQKEKKTINSFLLILVSAKTKASLNLTNILEKKKEIITSDYSILTNNKTKININEIFTKS